MVDYIKVLALDIDGVLTDGTTTITEFDREEKRISFQDIGAVGRAKHLGLTVVLVTGESTPAVDLIAKRFGIDVVLRGAKDKLAALSTLSAEMGIPLNEFCYVGDANRDAPALAHVGLGLAPANATQAAKAASHRVLTRSGGMGAVNEAVNLLTQYREDGERTEILAKEITRIISDSIAAHHRLLDESVSVIVSIAQSFIRAIRSGHKILLFGNGGSAADAQHVAGELVGRFHQESEPWPAIALTTDTSILTAVGNDWDFAEIFSRQVRALARPGDVVVGISTSGKSTNVLRALHAARECGATTIGFTGADGLGMKEYADICFLAPAEFTPRIQELHSLAFHSICELVERGLSVS